MSTIRDDLKSLKHQAKELTSTVVSLNATITEEAARLNREAEAKQLAAMLASISGRLENAKQQESLAKDDFDERRLVSQGRLAIGGIIKILSSDNTQPIARVPQVFNTWDNEQLPYGTVLVSVGPKGIPNDMVVISISKLARDSNRSENEVIKQLQSRGYLLFNEKEFSFLVDRLIDTVRKGRLHSPISRENVSEIMQSI